MNCIFIVLLILLFYFLFYLTRYHIGDKFEKEKYNPIAEDFFDNNVQVYVINMSKHKPRLNFMKDQMGRQKINFIRIEAVDGKTYDRNYINNWPFMKGDMYDGTKGIQLSNLKVMKLAIQQHKPWVLILEDDNLFTKNFKEKVYNGIHKYPNTNIFHLDKRWYQNPLVNFISMKFLKKMVGARAQLYNKEVLPILIKELDYKTSDMINKYPFFTKAPPLFDNYLPWLILTLGIDYRSLQLNKDGAFESTIGGTSTAKGKSSF